MNIIQDFIPKGAKNRPGTKLTGPLFITIHDTANASKGANALMHAKYLKGTDAANRQASWHFTVDDTNIVQHLPLDEVGWHAGDGAKGQGNTSSIAIEICENADGDRAKAEDNAAKLTAFLLKELNLAIDKVVQHNKWSGKNCPHIIRGRKDGWSGFLAKVQEYLTPPVPDDVKGHWAEKEIRQVIAEGKMKGTPDGFKPNDPITRGEIAYLIAHGKI